MLLLKTNLLNRSIRLIDGTPKGRTIPGLSILANKLYFTLQIYQELEPHHQFQLSAISWAQLLMALTSQQGIKSAYFKPLHQGQMFKESIKIYIL